MQHTIITITVNKQTPQNDKKYTTGNFINCMQKNAIHIKNNTLGKQLNHA